MPRLEFYGACEVMARRSQANPATPNEETGWTLN
jgi:hypothetical protein